MPSSSGASRTTESPTSHQTTLPTTLKANRFPGIKGTKGRQTDKRRDKWARGGDECWLVCFLSVAPLTKLGCDIVHN